MRTPTSRATEPFTGIPHDSNRLLALVVLADVAATLADRVGAAVLLELLVAHQHRQALLNCFGGGGAYWGPVTMYLARLAALVDDDRAASWTAAARRSCDDVGATLAAARIDTHRERVG